MYFFNFFLFIIKTDISVANLLFAFRDMEFITIFLWITLLAESKIIISATIIFSLILWMLKKKMYLFPLWVTIFGSGLFVFFGKLAFHRSRPLTAYYVEDSFSFPSGHAAFAIALYGFLVYVLFRHIKQWKYKISILLFGVIVILMIGFSRLYLGVHFLSDVLGGYLLGMFWLLIGITFAEFLQHRKEENTIT